MTIMRNILISHLILYVVLFFVFRQDTSHIIPFIAINMSLLILSVLFYLFDKYL